MNLLFEFRKSGVIARCSFNIARRTGSMSVKADGWHHRSDALSLLVILAGIDVSRYLWWIDAALVENIQSFCKAFTPVDIQPHHFHTHHYGDHTELTFHVCLPVRGWMTDEIDN